MLFAGSVSLSSPVFSQQADPTGAEQIDIVQIRELLGLLDEQIAIFDEKLAAMEEEVDITQDPGRRAALESAVSDLTRALDTLDAQKATLEVLLAAIETRDAQEKEGGQ